MTTATPTSTDGLLADLAVGSFDTVREIASGYNSRVTVISHPAVGEAVLKVMRIPRSCEVAQVIADIRAHREGLAVLGIAVPELITSGIIDESDEAVMFATVEVIVRRADGGEDFLPTAAREGLYPTIAAAIEHVYTPLFAQSSCVLGEVAGPRLLSSAGDYLPFGIDTGFRNFVFDDVGTPHYLDFFPPKVAHADFRGSLEIPDPIDPDFRATRIYNHFDRAGVWYTAFVNAAREAPHELDRLRLFFHAQAVAHGWHTAADDILASPLAVGLDRVKIAASVGLLADPFAIASIDPADFTSPFLRDALADAIRALTPIGRSYVQLRELAIAAAAQKFSDPSECQREVKALFHALHFDHLQPEHPLDLTHVEQLRADLITILTDA